MEKPRKIVLPIFLVVLGFLLPGAGQVFNGDWKKAKWIFVLLFAIVFMLPLFSVLPGTLVFLSLVIVYALYLFLIIRSLIDTWRTARNQSHPQGMSRMKPMLVYAAALGLFLFTGKTVRNYVSESYVIPSSSMRPTLLKGDHFIVTKLIRLSHSKGSELKRGDVIIHKGPNTPPYVRRVIGLPGDHVKFQGNRVFVNEQELQKRELTKPEECGAPLETDETCFEEHLNGKIYRVIYHTGSDPFEAYMKFLDVKVPPGHLFLVGDNRANSSDSRFQGPVDIEETLGRARTIWGSWPENNPTRMKWDRIGIKIE